MNNFLLLFFRKFNVNVNGASTESISSEESFEEDLFAHWQHLSISKNDQDCSSSCSSISTTLNKTWLKPRIPDPDFEFLGVITFIDEEGQIYIQNENANKVCRGMTKVLTEIHSKIPMNDRYSDF